MTSHANNHSGATACPGYLTSLHRTPEAGATRLYNPWDAAEDLGLHIRYAPLRDSWSWWVPDHRLIVVADRLTQVQERCALAHEVEHALNGDTECSNGAPIDRVLAHRQEIHADEAAARKLIPVVDLEAALHWATSHEEAAQELDVTEHMLRVRLRIRRRELECLDTSKIVG
ncbi:hypothetical protein T261_06018 [Streptomyces lydicus]|nr:hypothetical protein T261_06018 [Streptomyces lydicus]